MTRRNRQKLHKELRLEAEARKARKALVRRQRQARSLAMDQAVQRTLAGHARPQHSPANTRNAHLGSMRQLMDLARVPGRTQRRVVRLYEVTAPRMPRMADLTRLPTWLLLARQGWVRQPEQWVSPPGSDLRKLRSLVRHLLVRWDAPEFLVRALESVPPANVARVPTEDEWAVVALAHLGRGESLRTLVGTPRLPTPLSQRMVSYFVKSRAQLEPIHALRLAQVRGFGGPPRLAQDLVHTRLGVLRGPHPELGETFWHRVIQWLCPHEVRPDLLEEVLAWAEADRRQALAARKADLVPWRRSVPAVVEEVLHQADLRTKGAWRRQRELPASGLPAGPVPGHEAWQAVELRTAPLLSEEGEAMSHCATHYRHLVARRRASLWSLRHEDGHRLTVEVSLGSGAVVQAKRKANAAPTASELAVVRAWAEAAALWVRV